MRVIRVSTASGERIIRRLKIPEHGMLAQMNGHGCAVVAQSTDSEGAPQKNELGMYAGPQIG